jgi:hypothetical protein
MTVQYYAAFGVEGGSYELIPCSNQDEARNLARDRLGPLLKSTEEEVFSCVYAGPSGAKSLSVLQQVEELWRGGG